MSNDNLKLEVSKDILNLLENSTDYNVKIKVGDEQNQIKEFKAHSLILSARSKFFRTVLSKEHANEKDGFILICKPNISPPVFDIILK
jgi:hypothetical protein